MNNIVNDMLHTLGSMPGLAMLCGCGTMLVDSGVQRHATTIYSIRFLVYTSSAGTFVGTVRLERRRLIIQSLYT